MFIKETPKLLGNFCVIFCMKRLWVILFVLPLFAQDINKSTERWYKGNLHTHTLWSDGDAPPEMIVSWYKDHGYDFLTLSDHNILSLGEKWIPVSKNNFNLEKLEKLKAQFGDNSVHLRSENGSLFMRLKTLEELREQFQETERFILIQLSLIHI